MGRAYVSGCAGVLALCLLLVSGCGADSPASGDASGVEQGRVEFEGPYAAEFRELYDSSDSDFVRQVLADGEISAAEIQEAKNRIARCFEDAGAISVEFDGDDGAMSVGYEQGAWPEPAKEEEVASQCQVPEIYILALNGSIQRDPGNVDLAEEQYKCLVGFGVVEPSMSFSEFEKMAGQDGVSSVLDTVEGNQDLIDRAVDCINDPLNQNY